MRDSSYPFLRILRRPLPWNRHPKEVPELPKQLNARTLRGEVSVALFGHKRRLNGQRTKVPFVSRNSPYGVGTVGQVQHSTSCTFGRALPGARSRARTGTHVNEARLALRTRPRGYRMRCNKHTTDTDEESQTQALGHP